MPSVSKETATPIDQGGAGTEWRAELDGYTTSFVEVKASADLTELLKGLPGDVCPSPHWGYVFKGRMWWRYSDSEEHQTGRHEVAAPALSEDDCPSPTGTGGAAGISDRHLDQRDCDAGPPRARDGTHITCGRPCPSWASGPATWLHRAWEEGWI